MDDKPLTDEQIENWRRVLCGMLGPYAFIMPKEQVQRLRDKMQRDLNAQEPAAQGKCECEFGSPREGLMMIGGKCTCCGKPVRKEE